MASERESTGRMNQQNVIDDLLDEWEDAHERGQTVNVDELCRNVPQLKEELKRRIDALLKMNQRLSPEGPVASAENDGETLRSISEITGLAFHAKGGLGAVYRGTERELNRQVAVKFIHHSLVRDRDSCDRFTLEAEVTGRLEHPGIVPLYGIGQAENGRLFYYMRYIDGETLDEAILHYHQTVAAITTDGEQSVEFRRLLSAFISVCKTVAYAHNRGIVHRDIKPANVMLGKYGETIVVDWGLAIPVNRDDRFRNSGEVTLMPTSGSQSGSRSGGGAGTLAYMSPEQASDLAPTPASDVYSLGASLYKILCGQPAFTGDDGHQIRQNVMDGRFRKPSERLRSLSRTLEAICLKAMSLQPRDRYVTALELAADVENYLADAPVSVVDESRGRKLGRWIRQHRLAAQSVAIGVAVVVLISILAAVWLGTLASSEKQARKQANQIALSAESARRHNLRSSARFLAKSIAYEIDLRWRLLESEAQAERLQSMLLASNAAPDDQSLWEPMQAWLNERMVIKGSAVKNTNWGIFSQSGVQVARSPRGKSLGQSFRHRDYFHGLGRDLEPAASETTMLKPLEYLLPKVSEDELVHLSCVYQSAATDKLVVSFSVPVWDSQTSADRTVLGLLSMTLEIDAFGLPNEAMLFQLKESQITGKPGAVFAHPQLKKRKETRSLPSVNAEVVSMADDLRSEMVRLDSVDSASVALIDNFADPMTGETHLAAVEPVMIKSRPEIIGDIGWVLVVYEDSDGPAEGTAAVATGKSP